MSDVEHELLGRCAVGAGDPSVAFEVYTDWLLEQDHPWAARMVAMRDEQRLVFGGVQPVDLQDRDGERLRVYLPLFTIDGTEFTLIPPPGPNSERLMADPPACGPGGTQAVEVVRYDELTVLAAGLAEECELDFYIQSLIILLESRGYCALVDHESDTVTVTPEPPERIVSFLKGLPPRI